MKKLIVVMLLALVPIFPSTASEQASFQGDDYPLEAHRALNYTGPAPSRTNLEPSFGDQCKQYGKIAALQLYNIGSMAYIIEGRFKDIMDHGSPFERNLVTLTVFSGTALALQISRHNLLKDYFQRERQGLPRVLPCVMTMLLLLKIFCV